MKGKCIAGVIFDCDGTLIDSEYYHLCAWRDAIAKRGLALAKDDYKKLAGLSVEEISQRLYRLVKVDSPQAIAEDKVEIYRTLQERGIPPLKRMVDFVRQLASQKGELGIKLGLASAAYKDEILINLKHLGLESCFDAVISGKDDLAEYSDPEGVNKPKPYIYLHTAKSLGVEPAQCAAFEDSSAGVISAASAGMITFAVPNEYTQHHDFSRARFILGPDEELEIASFFRRAHEQNRCN